MAAVRHRSPKIRLSWQLTRAPLHPAVLRAQQIAGMAVGRCTCSALAGAFIDDISVQQAARTVWLTLRCHRCGTVATHHGRLDAD